MKCDEYQVQRPSTNAHSTHTAINRQQSFEPLAKRKCIENGTTQAGNDPVQTKQLAVIKKSSAARLSTSMSKIGGTQVRIQKVASTQQSANATLPLSTSVGTTGKATATADNVLKIKNVKSLHQSATTSTATQNPLNNDNPQKKTGGGGNNTENVLATDSAKKIRVISVSKIPGRSAKVLIPVTSISTGQINAQSTPNKPVAAAKNNFIPEDPLKISDEPPAATAELAIEPSINRRPAFVKEVTLHQSNQQLSTSLPLMKVTATRAPNAGIVTRSRNINSERQKPSYKCDSCAFTTEVEQNLMRHSLSHTADKPLTCKICKKRFPRRPLLLAHMREHHHELHSDLAYWDTNSNWFESIFFLNCEIEWNKTIFLEIEFDKSARQNWNK